ncbi:hypothetical protein PG994_005109 [Apiospora phragmitis]|uniref:Uncharacterized protein n=1 Tax=Apiospora phragmitis TaxID=2905665 RepID=A0ABR1VVJ7_9PEZI
MPDIRALPFHALKKRLIIPRTPKEEEEAKEAHVRSLQAQLSQNATEMERLQQELSAAKGEEPCFGVKREGSVLERERSKKQAITKRADVRMAYSVCTVNKRRGGGQRGILMEEESPHDRIGGKRDEKRAKMAEY